MKNTCLLCCIRSFPQHKQKLMIEQLVKALSDYACSHFREREQNCYLGSGLYVKVFFNRLLPQLWELKAGDVHESDNSDIRV